MRGAFWWLSLAAIVAMSAAGPSWAQETQAEEAESAEADHGGEHAGGEHHEDLGHGDATASLGSPAEFRTDLAIYTFVVFLLLLAILSAGAWPKISHALEEREKRIEGAIADAQAKHEEAKRLLAAHEAKLAAAAAEVKAMLDEARRDAEATKTEIVSEAREAAKAEHQRAQRDIEVALNAATKHLGEMSANLAVELAGKVIRETINPAKSQELVREALAKLSATAPSRN
jgi:F-type H+-transporting ATPase subunit b